jgi:hypothetical protein
LWSINFNDVAEEPTGTASYCRPLRSLYTHTHTHTHTHTERERRERETERGEGEREKKGGGWRE